jgi:UDP-N-acetylglucosamine--N-acetylmuramyl-(pentapeptide) pyrophosphoryl-undecaprenol N-acetylglucosamine transferase
VLLAGGGSGGHVFPALAVGEELRVRGHRVSFAGSARGIEARLVPERGVEFHALRSRPMTGRGPVGKALAVATLLVAGLAAARLVRRLAVDAVVGTGGYASAPAILGAVLVRRPALLVEPNARPGFANRQLSRWAAGAAVAFPQTGRELACPSRVSGVPVREAFFRVAPEPAGDRHHLLVLGGSQGARSLNLALPEALAAVVGRDGVPADLEVLHQTGAAHLEETRAAYERAGLGAGPGAEPRSGAASCAAAPVRLEPFVDDMAGALAASHLVVSRAGAITLAEIAAAGRAAVLVPLSLAEGHQRDNALAFQAVGAARVVEAGPGAGPETLAPLLGRTLAGLLVDRDALAAMGRAARGLARPGAAAAIADWVEELAGAGGRAA